MTIAIKRSTDTVPKLCGILDGLCLSNECLCFSILVLRWLAFLIYYCFDFENEDIRIYNAYISSKKYGSLQVF